LPAQRQTADQPLSELLQREIAYFQTHREHLHYQAAAREWRPRAHNLTMRLRLHHGERPSGPSASNINMEALVSREA
jgi:hypothetical protein